MVTLFLNNFILRFLQSRFADKWFRNLSFEDRKTYLHFIWSDLNKGLNYRDQYLLLHEAYEHRRMKNYPLLDSFAQAKLFGLFALVDQIRLIEGDIVETGVGRGLSLAAFAYACSYFKLNKVIYGFDSFQGFPGVTSEDIGIRVKDLESVSGWETTSQDLVNSVFEIERKKDKERSVLVHHDVEVKLIPGFFEKTIPTYLPEKIALLHVDCDLYQSYKLVLGQSLPCMVSGGLIVFDEYDDKKWPGAKKAVDEFCAEHELALSYFEPLQRYMIKLP